MDEKAIHKYCRQVGKHLKCFQNTKAALLAGLREELLLSEDGEVPSPKETAAVLQESVSDNEFHDYQKSVKLWHTTIIAAVVVLIFIVVFNLLWDTLPISQVTFPPVEE